ncbi:TetR/AcrR family transcriptional regulator [Streptomyces acidicola]|uniref:TetR/AcrR family transcriptional regulator n=1 Tax=Streptomyces acidicola TaxID=2596892 RepID=UPI003427EC81
MPSRQSAEDHATATAGRRPAGRPPLTERRKAATRLEIAREAVRLFTRNGVAATSIDDIAEAAEISARTLRRYFPTKESCVTPLLTAGIEMVTRVLEAWPQGRPLSEVIEQLHEARDSGDEPRVDITANLALIRLTRTEPGLRALWLESHREREDVFAQILGERTGRPADDLRTRTQAGMLASALRIAIEQCAWQDDTSGAVVSDIEELLLDRTHTALLTVMNGLHE